MSLFPLLLLAVMSLSIEMLILKLSEVDANI